MLEQIYEVVVDRYQTTIMHKELGYRVGPAKDAGLCLGNLLDHIENSVDEEYAISDMEEAHDLLQLYREAAKERICFSIPQRHQLVPVKGEEFIEVRHFHSAHGVLHLFPCNEEDALSIAHAMNSADIEYNMNFNLGE